MTRAFAGKELRVLWTSPIPYVVAALFQAVVAVLYLSQLEDRRQALMQPFFPIARICSRGGIAMPLWIMPRCFFTLLTNSSGLLPLIRSVA